VYEEIYLAEATLPSNVEKAIFILEIFAKENPLTEAIILINAHFCHMIFLFEIKMAVLSHQLGLEDCL